MFNQVLSCKKKYFLEYTGHEPDEQDDTIEPQLLS